MCLLNQLVGLIALHVALDMVAGRWPEAVHIRIPENVTVSTVVLQDIRSYLNFPVNSVVHLGPGSLNEFFRLDAQTGELIVTNRMDLEDAAICKTDRSCCRKELHEYDKSLSPMGLMDKYPITSLEPGVPKQTLVDQCNLMAFILLKPSSEAKFTPVTQFYVTVIDVNDHTPTFKVPVNAAIVPPSGSLPPQDHPVVISLNFLEGPGGLDSRHDLPSAYDADFSPQNRVKRYWLEWIASDTVPNHVTNGLEQVHPNMLSVNEAISHSVGWAILGPFRLIYLEAGRTIALELNTELDCELKQQYKLKLIAEDGGGLRGALVITINVIDVNEFPPVFTDSASDPGAVPLLSSGQEQEQSRIYRRHYKVRESHEVGTEIGRLHATDADFSTGSKLHYRLGSLNPTSDGKDTFRLDASTGVLTLKSKLDYETVKQYRLTVIAEDGSRNNRHDTVSGKPYFSGHHLSLQRSATAIVDISVVDVNDNAPAIRFEKEERNSRSGIVHMDGLLPIDRLYDQSPTYYSVSIKEDAAVGSSVVFFTANDRDMGENGRIHCKLTNWTNQFTLQDFGGGLFGIQCAAELDRESIDKYHVPIQCRDLGNPSLATSQLLIVNIEDVNDMPPYFTSKSYHFRVPENSPSGTRMRSIRDIYTPSVITAADPDLNSTIRYRLEPADVMNEFQTSVASALSPLSRDHHLFRIDPMSGEITTQGELDREQYPQLDFKVCADDNIHVTCTHVQVTLDDVNDNRPRFDRDTYVLRVEENQLQQEPVVTFKVIDADVGNQGFTFNFAAIDLASETPALVETSTSPDNSTFIQKQRWRNVGPGTMSYHFILRDHSIFIRRPLDREIKANYHFFVEVVDSQRSFVTDSKSAGHSVQLKGQAEIFIDITDINDNSPIFIFPNSTSPPGNNRLTISCHEAMGITVGQIQASDVDLGQNGTVIFSLVSTPEVSPLFHLDSQTGDLFVNTGQLSEKCGETVLLVISVDDMGPRESKLGRPMTMERLVVAMEDRPTKAELMAAAAKQQEWHASMTESLANKSDDNQLAISTKTVLSVVLGGSTVFIISILIIWLVLLLYHRSKRIRRQQHRKEGKHLNLSYPPVFIPNSPGCGETADVGGADNDDQSRFRSIRSCDPQSGMYKGAILCERVTGEDGKLCEF